jgi:hypothetical protein
LLKRPCLAEIAQLHNSFWFGVFDGLKNFLKRLTFWFCYFPLFLAIEKGFEQESGFGWGPGCSKATFLSRQVGRNINVLEHDGWCNLPGYR